MSLECTGREGSKVRGQQRPCKAAIASYEPQSVTCILDSCVRQPHELHQQGELPQAQKAGGNHPAPGSQQDHPRLNTLAWSSQVKPLRDQVCQGDDRWPSHACAGKKARALRLSLSQGKQLFLRHQRCLGDPERQAWHIHIVFWPT